MPVRIRRSIARARICPVHPSRRFAEDPWVMI